MHTSSPKRWPALAILIAAGVICPLIATSSYAKPVCELICYLDDPFASTLSSPSGPSASVSFAGDPRPYPIEYNYSYSAGNSYSINLPAAIPSYTHFRN